MDGFVPISRRSLAVVGLGDAPLLAAWLKLNDWARWQAGEQQFGDGPPTLLERGQCATSSRGLAAALGVGRSVAARCLSSLERLGLVRLEAGRLLTIVSILDYGEATFGAEKSSHQSSQPPSHPPPPESLGGEDLQSEDQKNRATLRATDRAEVKEGLTKKGIKNNLLSSSDGALDEPPPPGDGDYSFSSKLPPVRPATATAATPRAPTPVQKTWSAYAEAYETRYGFRPPGERDGRLTPQVGGLLANLVSRVGPDAAPHVVAFFVGHDGDDYVSNAHTLKRAIADAEKLFAEWKLSRQAPTKSELAAERRARPVSIYRALPRQPAADRDAPAVVSRPPDRVLEQGDGGQFANLIAAAAAKIKGV